MKVYLDNAASTRIDDEVVKVVQKCMNEIYGNPSSIHYIGSEANDAINNARKIIAKKLNCKEDEIIFTSGGTEANNICIKGLLKGSSKKHLVTSKIEHSSIISSCEHLEKEGYKVTFVGVDKFGMVDPKEVEKAITENTALVSIMHANNEVGTIQPLEEIGKICKKKNVLFHTDAVQSFLKLPIDVKKLNLDAVSISSHKVHGPKGTGVLYLKKGLKLDKLMDGGKHEFDRRAGTQNVSGIVGFGKAVEVWKDSNIKKLRDYMIEKLEKIGGKLNGHRTKRLQNNVNVSFDDLDGENILLHLSCLGVAVATGSACQEKEIQISYVLHAMGLEKNLAKGAIRLTLCRNTTKKEIDYAIDKVKEVVKSLKEVE